MTEKKISDALSELRNEITKLDSGDETTKQRLTDLVENIEQKLDISGGNGEHHDLIQDLDHAISQFEVEHPRITGIINDLLVTLNNAGI